jgi:hypothetical protein
MSDLGELLKRVEAATGKDEDLDLTLARALVPDVVCLGFNSDTGKNEAFVFWKYTASIDDALALVQRKLPGVVLEMGGPFDASKASSKACWEGWSAIIIYGMAENQKAVGFRKTLPLAILAALLAALIAQEADDA